MEKKHTKKTVTIVSNFMCVIENSKGKKLAVCDAFDYVAVTDLQHTEETPHICYIVHSTSNCAVYSQIVGQLAGTDTLDHLFDYKASRHLTNGAHLYQAEADALINTIKALFEEYV